MSKFDKDSENYTHSETCRNCGHVNIVSIQKGTMILDALEYKSCSKCGVKLRPNEFDKQTITEVLGRLKEQAVSKSITDLELQEHQTGDDEFTGIPLDILDAELGKL